MFSIFTLSPRFAHMDASRTHCSAQFDQKRTVITYRKYSGFRKSYTTQEKSTNCFCSPLINKHPSGYPENSFCVDVMAFCFLVKEKNQKQSFK